MSDLLGENADIDAFSCSSSSSSCSIRFRDGNKSMSHLTLSYVPFSFSSSCITTNYIVLEKEFTCDIKVFCTYKSLSCKSQGAKTPIHTLISNTLIIIAVP